MGGFQFAGGRVEHRKEGADGDVGVDVRGAVERIDRDQQRPVGVDRDRGVALLGNDAAHARAFEAVDEGLVGEHVERLLREAVVGRADRGVERAGEPAAPDEMDERQRGFGERAENARDIGGRVRAQERVEVVADPWHVGHECPSLARAASSAARAIAISLYEYLHTKEN